MSKRKIGAGHAAGMGRLGLKELRNAFNPSRESVADNEIGLYGTMTQGEIAEARSGPGVGPEQESRAPLSLEELRGMAKDQAKESERGKEQGRDNERGGMEM